MITVCRVGSKGRHAKDREQRVQRHGCGLTLSEESGEFGVSCTHGSVREERTARAVGGAVSAVRTPDSGSSAGQREDGIEEE